MTVEEWRVVPSDPTLMASSWGRIQVIPYRKEMPRHGASRTYGGTPTYGQWDGSRYVYVRKHHKTRKVARLVCEAFNGPCPHPNWHCMHLDEDATNNTPSNLRWGTAKENMNFPKLKEYQRSRVGNNSAVKMGQRRKQEST